MGHANAQVAPDVRLYFRLCNDFNETALADCPIQDYGNVVARVNSSSAQVKCFSVGYSDAKTFKDEWTVEFRDRLEEYYTSGDKMSMVSLKREAEDTNGTAITYTTAVEEKDLAATGISFLSFGLICNESLMPEQSVFR